MIDSAREVRGSVRMGGKNPKNMWWNDAVRAAVERKEAAWKVVLGLEMKIQKKGVWKCIKMKRER